MKKVGKILALTLLVVLMISFFVGVVAAQDIFDPVKDMFAKWSGGNLSVNIAKYIFTIILLIFVFSILDLIPPVKNLNFWLKFILAILISFLATAYLTPSEVYVMLIAYSAMGFVLGALIPFAILIFFSLEVGKVQNPTGKLFIKLVWFAFIIFLVYKTIAGAVSKQLTAGWTIAYIAFIVLSIVYIAAFQNALVKAWFKEESESAAARLARKLELQQRKRDAESKSMATED